MSGMEFYVRDEKEKQELIRSFIDEDQAHIDALDAVRERLTAQGVDITTPEGRKLYILEVRKLSSGEAPACGQVDQ